jgi:spore germination protein YaaH
VRRRTALAAAVAAALALASTAPASASRHSRHARHGSVQAFLLTSSPDSLADLRAHAGAIGTVFPTYFDCQAPSGAVTGQDIPSVDSFARAHGIAVMPRFNCQDGAVVHRILTEGAVRSALLARLTAIARAPAFAGICLDLENDGPGDREALSSFVGALAGALHAHHRRLTMVVDGVTREGPGAPNAFYDDRALSASADTVFVMAWGTHWAGSAPGAITTLPYVEGVVKYLSTLPNRARFVIGAPMYGLDWTTGGGSGQPISSGPPATPAAAYEFARVRMLARTVGAHSARDPASQELTFSYTGPGGIAHQVWYMDAHAVLEVLRIAHASGFRVGLWRLGTEDQALWSAPLVQAGA